MKFKYPAESDNYKTFKVRGPIADKPVVIANLDEIRANNGGKDIQKTFDQDGPTMFEIWVDTTFSKFMVETKLAKDLTTLLTVTSPR